MKRWFSIPSSNIIVRGDFERVDLILNAGSKQQHFLKVFGERVVDIYLAPLNSLTTSGLLSESDIKRVTRRLFTESNAVTESFIRFAGEVISAWAEESFTKHTIVRRPKPHDSTPCFDAIALCYDKNRNLYLCFIQAKTTEANVAANANSSAVDLGKLDSGDFDIELAGAIEEIAERLHNPSDKEKVLKALIDPMCRRFRIVVLHSIKAPRALLGRYCDHVLGDRCRRNASFLQLAQWDSSWKLIGDAAYAKIDFSKSK
jgi:hypothetical protein